MFLIIPGSELRVSCVVGRIELLREARLPLCFLRLQLVTTEFLEVVNSLISGGEVPVRPLMYIHHIHCTQ